MRFSFFKRLFGREIESKLKSSLEEISILYQISQSLAQTLELGELLPAVTRTLVETLHVKELALSFFDDGGEFLEVQAAYGFRDNSKIRGMIFKPGKGAVGQAATQKEVVTIDDSHSEPGSFHDGPFVCVPLIVGEKVAGVMSVGDERKRFFQPTEVKFLEAVANQIAIAYDRSKLYTRTKELSVTDELTGVNNRRHFQHVLHMEWKRASRFDRPLSLLMIDVDHFKEFNDTHGHLKGDEALKEMARLLLLNVREVDTVARFGGEEFVILLADTKFEEALMAAEKLRNLVEKKIPHLLSVLPVKPLTVSIGVSAYPDLALGEEELINTADSALYRAKSLGRNRVVGYSGGRAPLFPLTASKQVS